MSSQLSKETSNFFRVRIFCIFFGMNNDYLYLTEHPTQQKDAALGSGFRMLGRDRPIVILIEIDPLVTLANEE